MKTLMIIVLTMAFISCKKSNLFVKDEKPLSAEEEAVKYLEVKKPKEALNTLLNLATLEDRKFIEAPQNSPTQKTQVLIRVFSKFKNKDTLLSLYAISLLATSNVDLLKIGLEITQKKDLAAQDIMEFLFSYLPVSEQITDSLDIAIIVGKLTPDAEKKIDRLTIETMTLLLGSVSRLLGLDANRDKKITAKEVESITVENAQVVYECLALAETKIGFVLKKTNEKSYEKIFSTIHTINQDIQKDSASKIEDKVKNFLIGIFNKSGKTEISISGFSQESKNILIVKGSDPKIPSASLKENPYRSQLIQINDTYAKLRTVDEWGWITDTKCDGLLFNSIYGASGGNPKILSARDDDLMWHRHPLKDCYSNHESKSTISRDMLIGLSLWIMKKGEFKVLQDLIAYGKNHQDSSGQWVMGEGDDSRIKINIGLQEIFLAMEEKLSKSHSPREFSEQPVFLLEGYEGHLELLALYLRSLIYDGVSQVELELLKSYLNMNPQNALASILFHKFTDGEMKEPSLILLSKNLFPEDRLPTSNDRCPFYIWERVTSTNQDWMPCPKDPPQVYSGVDFQFALSLILNE